MGAWGYAPDDNDNVRDWVDSITSERGSGKVISQFKKLLKKKKLDVDDLFTIAGVVYGLVKDGYDVSPILKKRAITYLKRLITDSEFISSFGESSKYVSATKVAIRFLEEGERRKRIF